MNKTYTVDKNTPLPVRVKATGSNKRGRPPGSKFPVAEMEVGDSFFVPDVKRIALDYYNKHYCPPLTKLVYRRVEGGVRVYMISTGETP